LQSKTVEREQKQIISALIDEYGIQTTDDIQDALKDLLGGTIKSMMESEIEEHLGANYERSDSNNARNGTKKKTVHSTYGEFEIDVPQDRNSTFEPKIVSKRQKDIPEIDQKIISIHTSYGDMDVAIPRDRNGDYEPQLVKKYQNTVTQDMEEKIISMYAKGMTTGDIESHMKELYDIDISDSTISRITDKILPIVKEWQERPLEEVYAVVFMDAIHYHVRSEGRIVKRAVCIALDIDMNGQKDVLGMYVGENESAKFWLSIINGLKNRGVEEILIACVDGLNGFSEAISAVYPKAEIQQCIIH